MKPTEKLTDFDLALLRAVRRLGDNAYSLSIKKALAEEGRRSSLGAIAMRLDRLEEADYVRSHVVAGGPERRGRNKRLYYLGPASLPHRDLIDPQETP